MSGQYFIKLIFFVSVIFVIFNQKTFPATATNKNQVSDPKINNLSRSFLSGDQPIEINSDKLTADNHKKTAVFEGTVVVKQDTTTLYSDWMKLFYSEEGNIIKIHAKGSVKLSQEDKEITSNEAFFYRDHGKVIFTGNPVVKDRTNTISGSKMVYFIEDGRFIVENSRVIIKKANEKTKTETKKK